jgi:integrase
MGVLKDSKTGNYYIRIYHAGRQWEKVIGKDKKTADIALAEAKQDIRLKKLAGEGWDGFQKLQRHAKVRTFSQAASNYIEERANYKYSSISSYKSILEKYLLPEFGKLTVKSIDSSHLRKYQVKISKEISAARVNTIMQLLRSILAQEYREGHIGRDPTSSVRRMQEVRTDVDPLSSAELELALENIDQHYHALFITLAFTGARPNELLALRWSDIDWHKKTISITKGRVRGHEGLPKTRSGEREIPLADRVIEVLRHQKDNSVASSQGYIFISKKGTPINKHLDRVWARALRKAGMRHRPSYQLRHTFATQCIINGLPLPYIAKILGHSTIDTLVRHYTGWIDSATKQHDALLRDSFRQTIAKTEMKRNGVKKKPPKLGSKLGS